LSHADEAVDVAPALAAIEALTAWNSEPFEAKARIATGAGPSQAVKGSYHLLRRDAQTWREEIQLPYYRREIVTRGGTSWVEQQGEYQPIRVFDVDELLDFASRYREVAAATLRRDKSGKASRPCAVSNSSVRSAIATIDPADGLLRRGPLLLVRNWGRRDRLRGTSLPSDGNVSAALDDGAHREAAVTLTEELRLLDPVACRRRRRTPGSDAVDCERTQPTWSMTPDRAFLAGSRADRGSAAGRSLTALPRIDALRGSQSVVREILAQMRFHLGPAAACR
jgi:hypothetical protein